MRKLIINPQSGLAGDIFVAALCSAGIAIEEVVKIAEEAGKNLGGGRLVSEEPLGKAKGLLLNFQFVKKFEEIKALTLFEEINRICKLFEIKKSFKDFALKAFFILAKAEAQAHGYKKFNLSEIHLHEAADIVFDLSAAAFCLQKLEIDLKKVDCLAPVYLGGGQISFSHGCFAVPAPATRIIIKKARIPVAEGPLAKELLTPTGSSILAALKPKYLKRQNFKLENYSFTGKGIGSISFPVSLDDRRGLLIWLV